MSVDIDLFSDALYGSINFKAVDEFVEKTFPYHHHFSNLDPAMGKSYSVDTDNNNVVKLDVFYTDTFIQPPLIVDEIRMTTNEKIIAMKIDVVQRIGRKKDLSTETMSSAVFKIENNQALWLDLIEKWL